MTTTLSSITVSTARSVTGRGGLKGGQDGVARDGLVSTGFGFATEAGLGRLSLDLTMVSAAFPALARADDKTGMRTGGELGAVVFAFLGSEKSYLGCVLGVMRCICGRNRLVSLSDGLQFAVRTGQGTLWEDVCRSLVILTVGRRRVVLECCSVVELRGVLRKGCCGMGEWGTKNSTAVQRCGRRSARNPGKL